MSGKRQAARVMFALGVSLWAAAAAYAAEGSYLHSLGLRAGAGIASPRDASWMVVNPAAMVDLDKRLDLNLDLALLNGTLEPHGPLGNWPAGEMEDYQFVPVPSGGMVWPTGDGALGLGLYSSSGIFVDFPYSRNILTRWLQGNRDRRLLYGQSKLVLAGARTLDNGWAVGGALRLSVAVGRSDFFTRWLYPSRGDNELECSLGAGFALGVYRKWDRWAFGACVTSRQWAGPFHRYLDVTPYSVDLPEMFQAGIAYTLTPTVELVADYRFMRWSGPGFFGADPLQAGLGWRDQHSISVGAEWRVADAWTLRGGVSHGNCPVVPEHAAVDGLIPVTLEDHVTLGLSHAFDAHREVFVTYLHSFDHRVTASTNGDIYTFFMAGTKVGLGVDVLTIGYGYKF